MALDAALQALLQKLSPDVSQPTPKEMDNESAVKDLIEHAYEHPHVYLVSLA